MKPDDWVLLIALLLVVPVGRAHARWALAREKRRIEQQRDLQRRSMEARNNRLNEET